jgi:hypothetical protein
MSRYRTASHLRWTATTRPARQAGRTLPVVRGSPAHVRSATAITARMGTLVAGHDQTGHRRQLSRPPRARRRIGAPHWTGTGYVSCTSPAIAASGRASAGASHPRRPRGLLEPCAVKVATTVLRGTAAAMRRSYPTAGGRDLEVNLGSPLAACVFGPPPDRRQ